MDFPISSQIEPQQYGPKLIGEVLSIDRNAGSIPPAFAWSVLTAEPQKESDPPQQLCAGNVQQMSDEQWDKWSDQDSKTYILECVAELLGLTLIAATEDKPDPATPKKKTRR